jgi:large subunit ribosomal protein L3
VLKFLGKKRAMTQVFDKNGKAIACTLILMEDNVVVQIKKRDVDGYDALQIGAFEILKEKKVKKPVLGHFKKSGVNPRRHLKESRIEEIEKYKLGQTLDLKHFSVGDYVDVTSTSKGKGFQGVMKLHGFAGGPAAHGSGFHRHAGSTGMRSTPGRCFPGGKRASRMGGDMVTSQNLEILEIDEKNKLIAVKGSVPGSVGSLVCIKKAKKRKKS